MPFPPSNLSQFHNDVLKQTILGQLCGTKTLFRDRYLILRMLGRGGFGVTFLARDISLPSKPHCVIKQLCPRVSELKSLDTARLRFKREAKILAALGNHSRIPLLLDYFVYDEDFYLVQEYVRGATLARLVRRQGCQPEAVVKRILREVLELLEYVHNQGVIHRDIKPQNIILSQDRRLVLIDFGAVKEQLAQLEESSSIQGVTTHFVGTVGFAPPEQFALRPVYSSDIYALGVTALYLLTGKAPLDFQSDPRTGKLHWKNRVQLSRSFTQVLDKMLQPSVTQRYQTAREVINDLYPQKLSDCMNTQSTPTQASRKTKSSVSSQSKSSSKRVSRLADTAQAIRDWNARRSSTRPQKPLLRSSS